MILVVVCAYRFLSISTITIVATAIATIIPMVAGSKYMSAMDAGGGVGAGVASGACITLNAVSACEGQ